MTIEQIEQSKTNEQALLYAQTDAAMAARVVSLWSCPVIADQHVPEALGIPPSLWAQLKADGDTPKLFVLGRRLLVRTADLRGWLDIKARAGKPGSKSRRAAAAAAEAAT